MKVTYSKSDLAVDSAARNRLIEMFANAPHGGFIGINGWETKDGEGEKSNYVFCKGASYKNTVANSLAKLDAIEADPAFTITVKRNVWENAAKEISPTGCKNKDYPILGERTVTYSATENYPVLVAAFANVRKSLLCPEPVYKIYTQLGNGIYEDESGVLYLRDLTRVSKTVVVKGERKGTVNKKEETAVAAAIKRLMPISKYRNFPLNSIFDSISIGGMEVSAEVEINVPQVKTDATPIAAPVEVEAD